jgi:hypothetical protein
MKSSRPSIHQRYGIRLGVQLVESLLAQLGITPPCILAGTAASKCKQRLKGARHRRDICIH